MLSTVSGVWGGYSTNMGAKERPPCGCGLCFPNSSLLGRRIHENSSMRGDPYQQEQDVHSEGEDPGQRGFTDTLRMGMRFGISCFPSA